MLKLFAIPLALIIALASPAFASAKPKIDKAPPSASQAFKGQCFTQDGFIKNAPEFAKLRLHLDDPERVASFLAKAQSHMQAGSKPLPKTANSFLFFDLPDGVVMFIGFEDGCALGSGLMPARIFVILTTPPGGDDGSI